MISIIYELVKYQSKVDTMDYNTGVHDINTVINNVTNKPTNTISGMSSFLLKSRGISPHTMINRRIVMNLSHPNGASLNDRVTNLME